MMLDENGLIRKVVAGSDKIIAYKSTEANKQQYELELLLPYFVICEDGEHFKITDATADTVDEALAGNVGYVSKHQVYDWPTREALAFSEIAFLDERPEIVAWGDEATLTKFMDSGNKKLHPPSFKENLASTLKRERKTRPYPVLSSQLRKLRKTAKKRVYEVLLPALLPTEAKITIKKKDIERAKKVITGASILIVFDATGSMNKFALETANSIIAGIESLSTEVQKNTKMGFLFYRDETDEEKLVSIPLMPLRAATKALKEASGLMSGGGDVAEPILDATYFATHLYPWKEDGGEQGGGKRIIIGVLQGDAKPSTIGTLDSEDRIPAGLDVNSIASALREASIPMITVQAGPQYGDNLELVMQTLAEGSGGQFIRWDAGATQKTITQALVKSMTTEAKKTVEAGKKVITKMTEIKDDFTKHASIPLAIMDGELLERLRRNGVDFNIDLGKGGVLVRKGYILENEDLLQPKFQIDKETLQRLINLYSVLGTTGLDADSFLQSAGEAISAIAGEEFDKKDTIAEIVRKKLGIKFRSELLSFNLEYLTAMAPGERLKFTKRIQDAGNTLGQYLEAHLAEFDSLPSVWMPTAALP